MKNVKCKREFFLKVLVIVFLHFTFYTLQFASAQTDCKKYVNEVSKDELKKYLTVLCADSLEGRETGKIGQKRTVQYLANHYKNLGFEPTVGNGYFQQYTINSKQTVASTLTIDDKIYEYLKDYYFLADFDDNEITATEFVFAGYGIVEKTKNIDDYKGLDVKNKIVIVMNGEPLNTKGESIITGTKELSEWGANKRLKKTTAKEHGAKALFIVLKGFEKFVKDPTFKHHLEKPRVSLADTTTKKGSKQLPIVYIAENFAREILGKKPFKKTVKKLRKNVSYDLAVTAKATLKIDRNNQEQTAENVLAFLKGSEKPDELIVVSAHLDHLGKQGDKIYYGADDDGSGTAAIMELARVFKKAEKEGHKPKRSILFLNVSGEEKGLLGSSYYTNNPVYPLANTVANLNIDMIGRVDKQHENNFNYVYVIGSDKLSTELHELNEKANKEYVNIELDYTYNKPDDPNQFYYRSDHYNFAKNNIPVIFYFNGVHADYHKPSDTIDKINFDKMEKITRLVFSTAWNLANKPNRIKLDKASDMPNSR